MALPNPNHHKLRSKPPFGKARLGYDHQKNLILSIDGNKAEETTQEKSNFSPTGNSLSATIVSVVTSNQVLTLSPIIEPSLMS